MEGIIETTVEGLTFDEHIEMIEKKDDILNKLMKSSSDLLKFMCKENPKLYDRLNYWFMKVLHDRDSFDKKQFCVFDGDCKQHFEYKYEGYCSQRRTYDRSFFFLMFLYF